MRRRRHRIPAARVPRMTAQQSAQRQQHSTPWPKALDCLKGILRASRSEAALIAKQRRKRKLIRA